MTIKSLLNNLKYEESKFFKVKLNLNTKYNTLNENCIYSLIYIIKFLEYNNYTLTHICLNDFEIVDQTLFLIKDTHVVELTNDYYDYNESPKEKLEFKPTTLSQHNNKTVLYNSVGLFMYYLVTKKNKSEILDEELDELEYSKPYYFIKNTFDKVPCLIYL